MSDTELRKYTHRMRVDPYKKMICRMVSKPMPGSYKMAVAILVDPETGEEKRLTLNRGCVKSLRTPIIKRYEVNQTDETDDE